METKTIIGITNQAATMGEFFSALANHAFMQNAVLTGVLAGISCGVVGTFVVVKRITYIAGGIAHSVLAGMGLAYYLNRVHGVDWLEPLHGAILAALISAVVIGLVSLRAREREDTVISAVWSVGMALGIIFIALTPGYYENLMSYLFGNILMVSSSELWLLAGLDILVLLVVTYNYNRFTAVCFDEEFARLRGTRVEVYYLLILALIALTVVILSTVVGIVMVIALLTLPVAIAERFVGRLSRIMILASLISIALTTVGLAISFGPDWPSGAVIILLSGLAYLVVTAVGAVVRSR